MILYYNYFHMLWILLYFILTTHKLNVILIFLQTLKHRIVCQIRALVVVPTADLVSQVTTVFKHYCKGTKLKVSY